MTPCGNEDEVAAMRWLWWLLLLVFLMLAVGELYFLYLVLFDDGDAFPGTLDRRTGARLVFVLGVVLFGLYRLLRRLQDGFQAIPGAVGVTRRLERRVLAYARKSGGRLTVAEVALNSRCTVQEAEAALQELVRQNVAQVMYTPNLDPVYVISGFDAEAQAQAQDILNQPPGAGKP